jgi:hypothetical protein
VARRTTIRDLAFRHNTKPGLSIEILRLADLFRREREGSLPESLWAPQRPQFAMLKTLDEIAALKPTAVIAGHKDPKLDNSTAGIDQTRKYLEAFDAAAATSKNSDELQTKIKNQFKDLQLDIILKIGAEAQFAAPK